MRITFTKLDDRRHQISVDRANGPTARCGPQATDSVIPHDLVHAVVEQALSIRDGFWGAFAAGATFGGFEPVSGAKVLRRTGDAVMQAELRVNWCYRAWTGRSLAPGVVGPSPVTAEEVSRACSALDDARAKWDAIEHGGALVWEWSTS